MAAMTVLTRRALNRATLARQGLLDRQAATPAEMVSRLVALQAQEPRPPYLGLWARLQRFEPSALTVPLRERALVRAMFVRATLHLLTVEDYLAFRPTVRPVLERAFAAVGGKAGLDLARVLPAATEVLAGGPLTFAEIRSALARRFPNANDRMLGYAVRTHLPLVMVPEGGRWGFPAGARFAAAEPWLGRPVDGEPDPAGLARRYLAAFGPATAADLQTWSGLRGGKALLAGLRADLVELADDTGRTLYDLPDAPRPGPDTPAPVRFLPEFDNLLLAHADRSRVLGDRERPVTSKNLRVPGTVLVDGFVAGRWRLDKRRGVTRVEVTPVTHLAPAALAELEAEGTELSRFVEPEARQHEVVVSGPD